MSKAKGWTEIFDGGSPEAERKIFLALAEDMLRIQEANRQKAGASAPRRTLHAKLVAGFTHATLKLRQNSGNTPCIVRPDFSAQPG